MRRILFQETDFNSLPNPPAGFNYIGFDGSVFSQKGNDGEIENPGVGPTGPTGPAGSGSSDRLISSNEIHNMELVLDNKGTLNIPLMLPVSFTAVCDDTHYDGSATFTDTNYWEFEVQFQLNPNGEVVTMINNIFPILTNPGYNSGDVFIFTFNDHGIPDFTFELQLNDVTLPGGAGWTANLAVTQPPVYPSTIDSLGAIKLTSNSNDLIFGTLGDLTIPGTIKSINSVNLEAGDSVNILTNVTGNTQSFIFSEDGDLILPEGGDIKDSEGNSVLVGVTNSTVLPYLELTNDPFIFNPYAGEIVSFTKADYATGSAATDEIDTDLAITRGNNMGIYNPYLEPEWDNDNNSGPSPEGTLWSNEGWGDLTNLNERIYYSFYYALGGRLGSNVLSAELVMKDVVNNKYYKFDFTVWGNQSNGAPVTYTRTQINPVDGSEIGSPVTFEKLGYESPIEVNDPIDTNVTITRGNNQAIFNIALENSWTTNGFISPSGTEWNADGWYTLRNTKNRNYYTFYDAVGGQIGNNVIGLELIMHDIQNDNYYAVKFSSWTPNGNGGGFSYTRQLLSTSDIFINPDDSETIDIFVEDDGDGSGIGITRGNDGGAIYNPYREGEWDDTVSPGGTLWNINGWNDLTDILDRNYTTFYSAFGEGGLGWKVPGTECVMYIPETDEYYAIKFLSWTQNNNGGGFSYVRYLIDTTKLNEGIKFPDGTVLKSADGVGRVKHKASGGRRIEEAYGNKIVSVTEQTTTILTASASRTVSGDNRIWIDQTLSSIDNIIGNFSDYEIASSRDIEFSIDNTNWYTWTGGISFDNNERGFSTGQSFTYNEGDTLYMRYLAGGFPQVWWDKNDLFSGGSDFRGAVIDYHAFTGEGTFIGTIHIVEDNDEENITHTEVSSGDSDSQNDDLWYVQNEGTISYRRMDGESKTLKIQWSAKVFYGNEYYD